MGRFYHKSNDYRYNSQMIINIYRLVRFVVGCIFSAHFCIPKNRFSKKALKTSAWEVNSWKITLLLLRVLIDVKTR